MTLEELYQIRNFLYQACEDGDLELIKVLLSEMIINISEGLAFKVDKKNKTATLFENFICGYGITLPRTIELNNEHYLITGICNLLGFIISELRFAEDSAVKTIYNKGIYHFCLKKLHFPASLIELKDGWCFDTSQLTKIIISPSNKNFLFKDDKYLLGKSDKNNDDFDILLFASRDIKGIFVIPSNIKVISPYAFQQCRFLEKVIIPTNSNLHTIGKYAFDSSSNLKTIEIAPNSNLQVIGSYAFSFTKIKEILIPSKVTKICEGTFNFCKHLEKINILTDSNLQTIEKKVFVETKIAEIIFLPV